jgi:hypothetical protein
MVPAGMRQLTHTLGLVLLVLTVMWPVLHNILLNLELQRVTGHLPAQLRFLWQLLSHSTASQPCWLLSAIPAAHQ